MVWHAVRGRVWWVGFAVVCVIAAAFYLILGLGAKQTISEQVLSQEQTLARSESSNVNSFFTAFGSSLAALSLHSSIQNRDALAQSDLDSFIDQWKANGVVGGVLYLNKNGVVTMNSNTIGANSIGTNLSDRDYFIWAKNQGSAGEYFVGKARVSTTGASRGKVIVVVSTPIYQDGVFIGSLAASIEIKPLTDRYLGLMKVNGQSDVYLLGTSGDMLYSSRPSDTLGVNVFTPGNYLLGSKSISDMLKNSLNNNMEGRTQTEGYLIAYSPIELSNKNWLIVNVALNKDILDIVRPLFIRQVAILILVLISTFLFGVIIIRDIETQKKFPQIPPRGKLE